MTTTIYTPAANGGILDETNEGAGQRANASGHGTDVKGHAMHDQYMAFLSGKRTVAEPAGFSVPDDEINGQLFDFQRDIVRWALRRGRAALFADCGLGKTPMQLESPAWRSAV